MRSRYMNVDASERLERHHYMSSSSFTNDLRDNFIDECVLLIEVADRPLNCFKAFGVVIRATETLKLVNHKAVTSHRLIRLAAHQ